MHPMHPMLNIAVRAARNAAQKLGDVVKIGLCAGFQNLCHMCQIILVGDWIGRDMFVFYQPRGRWLSVCGCMREDDALECQQTMDRFFQKIIGTCGHDGLFKGAVTAGPDNDVDPWCGLCKAADQGDAGTVRQTHINQ